jgi:hypothetical protein
MESETMETLMDENVTEDVTDLEITPGLEGLNMLEITPGLIGLNLNILHVLDMHMREEAICVQIGRLFYSGYHRTYYFSKSCQ